MDLPVLGTEIDDIGDLDKKYLANEEQFLIECKINPMIKGGTGQRKHVLVAPAFQPPQRE